jgi:hypothetical protein
VHKKILDLVIITIFPLLIFIAVFEFGFKINYLESLILVFGIPSLYLSFRDRKIVKKVALFSLLVSIPIALFVELISVHDQAWVVPNTVFPFRLFGFSPIENYIWQFITVYIILIFYEHFCDKKFRPSISKRIRIMDAVLYSLAFMAVLLFLNESKFLHIAYPYLWFCIPFFIIPIILFLWKYPHFFKSFLIVQIFFLYIHLIFEVIGVKLSHWIYPSNHFIGWVSIAGQRFPVEEFVFVMIIGAFAACSYYEFFTDKKLA